MAVATRRPNNSMLYATLIFVGLFIIATVVAIIFYVKSEEHKTTAKAAESKLNKIATAGELRKIGTLVGTPKSRQSALATMVDYLDQMVALIAGGVAEDTSAESKVEIVTKQAADLSEMIAQDYPDIETRDPNATMGTGLLRIAEKLKNKLDTTANENSAIKENMQELQNRFDDAVTVNFEKEQTLLAEKESYRQEVEDIKKNYNELKAMVEQNSQQRVQTLMLQLTAARTNNKESKDQLLKTNAQLKMAENRMSRALEQLRDIKPMPDREVAAFQPDGKIISVDNSAKIVYLSIGSDDRVYAGLTFSVYDQTALIPKDGRGKAELEVFDVQKNISAARIIRSDIKNAIVLNDIVANLIWDSKRANVFIVAGSFDLDNNGKADFDATDKVRSLIGKWGGKVASTISIETDFVVLGTTPKILKKPTFEEMGLDPLAVEKYETSQKEFDHYNEVKKLAESLTIPVFNYERFLYLIGYKTKSTTAGAF